MVKFHRRVQWDIIFLELNCSLNKDLYFYTDSAGNKNPASTKPLSLKTKFPSLSEKVPGKDQPKQETPSKKPTTDPSGSSPKTQESRLGRETRSSTSVFIGGNCHINLNPYYQNGKHTGILPHRCQNAD